MTGRASDPAGVAPMTGGAASALSSARPLLAAFGWGLVAGVGIVAFGIVGFLALVPMLFMIAVGRAAFTLLAVAAGLDLAVHLLRRRWPPVPRLTAFAAGAVLVPALLVWASDRQDAERAAPPKPPQTQEGT